MALDVLWACRAVAADAPAPVKAAELFVQDRVWSAHLMAGAPAWQSMEPVGGGGGLGLLFFGGGRHIAAETDPGGALAGAIMKRGDANKDGVLDAAEMGALAGGLFDRWAAAAGGTAGTLDGGQVAAGLNALLDPEWLTRGAGIPFSLRAAEGKRNGLASLLGWEFKEVPASLTFAGVEYGKVGLRYKGNGTYMEAQKSVKRSLKVDLNQFTKGQALAGVAKLNFHNNVTDPSGMMESVAYHLYRDAGVPAPRTTYARVIVTVPGLHDKQYFGLYGVVENVDGRFAQDRFGTKRGAIFKPATFGLFADLGADWADYKQTYDAKTELTAAQARRVIDLSQLVTYASDARFAAEIGQFIDVDEFARYMAVTTYLSSLDSIFYTGQNFYLYLDPTSERFAIIPWDLDHAFGGIFGEPGDLARLSIRRPWVGRNRFLERLFKVEAFERAYLGRMDQFARTIFKPERFHAEVDALTRAIRPAVEAESKEMAAAFDKSVAEPAKGATSRPAFSFFAPKPVRSIKRFVDARTPSVVDQLAGKSQGMPAKGMGGSWAGRDTGGPGQTLAPSFLAGLKPPEPGRITREQFVTGFQRWFATWDANESGTLTKGELEAGIRKEVAPGKPGAPRGGAGWRATAGATTRPATGAKGG